MNKELGAAISIFKELGWDKAVPDDALSLPLGTPEQRRVAFAGLRSGEWGSYGKVAKDTYGWISDIDVDAAMLAVFAVRLGVDARRAVSVLAGRANRIGDDVMVAIIAERGYSFTTSFIQHACVARRRLWEHSLSAFGGVAVLLVSQLKLPVLENVEYMKDWTAVAAAVLGLKAEIVNPEYVLPQEEVIRERFSEHIHTGIAVGAPATGPFSDVLRVGVERGWLDREEAVDLVFAALDSAQRPGDRKEWLRILDALGVGNDEYVKRIDELVALLSHGDTVVVESIAPRIIASADDPTLVDVLAACLNVPSKKVLRTILTEVQDHQRPHGADMLADQLAALATDSDKTVSRLVRHVMETWSIASDKAEESQATRGLWQPTPPLWHVPRFDHGDESQEALTAVTAELMQRPSARADIVTERFLAVANAVAFRNTEWAKSALRGIPVGSDGVLSLASQWTWGAYPVYSEGRDRDQTFWQPRPARDFAVFQRLGQVPCLLSEPSADDLVIDIGDLVTRLEAYVALGAVASEADLFLALTRLKITAVSKETVKKLKRLAVPVVLQSGKLMSQKAGTVVADYLGDPLKEPDVVLSERWNGWWVVPTIKLPRSLARFPDRVGHVKSYDSYEFTTYPNWANAAFCHIGWSDEVQRDQGLVLRQAARRATPLPGGMAINILAAQRSMHSVAAEDSHTAVLEAWDRGLLRPGDADIAYLDWHNRPPNNVAALVTALSDIAQEGLLSVVWPVLDEVIAKSLTGPRIAPGTAEAAEAMYAFLSEVQAAVESGLADASVLDVPGVRALAARGGSSRAVSAAQQVVAALPSRSLLGVEPPPMPMPVSMDHPFDEVWPKGAGEAPVIADGVDVTAGWADAEGSSKILFFDLALPQYPDRLYRVLKWGWFYDLESEGQCDAYEVPLGTGGTVPSGSPQAWLHWDVTKAAVVVSAHRNWIEGKNGPLERGRIPSLSQSLITVVIGLFCQDGDAKYHIPHLTGNLIEHKNLGWASVREAVQTLLDCPAVSPARLVRGLEADIRLLPALWPLLTQSIRVAGAADKPPTWVNRVLDVALRYAPYLTEAARRGYIPADDAQWSGLAELAGSSAKSTAVAKARRLVDALGIR